MGEETETEMNYEFEIQKLELQLRHMREMHAIYRERVDAHETGMEYIGSRLAGIDRTLEEIAADLRTLTANTNKLVAVLLREHPNGGSDVS